MLKTGHRYVSNITGRGFEVLETSGESCRVYYFEGENDITRWWRNPVDLTGYTHMGRKPEDIYADTDF